MLLTTLPAVAGSTMALTLAPQNVWFAAYDMRCGRCLHMSCWNAHRRSITLMSSLSWLPLPNPHQVCLPSDVHHAPEHLAVLAALPSIGLAEVSLPPSTNGNGMFEDATTHRSRTCTYLHDDTA